MACPVMTSKYYQAGIVEKELLKNRALKYEKKITLKCFILRGLFLVGVGAAHLELSRAAI